MLKISHSKHSGSGYPELLIYENLNVFDLSSFQILSLIDTVYHLWNSLHALEVPPSVASSTTVDQLFGVCSVSLTTFVSPLRIMTVSARVLLFLSIT